MGLHSRSKSLPKLVARIESKEERFLNMGKYSQVDQQEGENHSQNADVIQLSSGRQMNRDRANENDFVELNFEKNTPYGQERIDMKRNEKTRSEGRNKFSSRIRIIFQSLFNLDKKSKDGLTSSQSYASQLDSNFELIENMAYMKCRSLPELNKLSRGHRKIKKSGSLSQQRPFLSNFLRKSRRRLNSFRERNRSHSSVNGDTAFGSSPDVVFDDRSLRRRRREGSTTFNDSSLPNSPLSTNRHFVLNTSPENSPVFTSERGLKQNHCSSGKESPSTENKIDKAKVRREKFRRSKTTGTSFAGFHASTSLSLSEASDIVEEEAETTNDVIISSASRVAQRRRRTLNRSQTIDVFDKKNLPLREDSTQGQENQGKNDSDEKDSYSWSNYAKELKTIVEDELKINLGDKKFDPGESMESCTKISEIIRCKIQTATKGVYKVAVQIFIGAIEQDGIKTAVQCNMDPKCDGFTAVSFTNDSLFAFASVLVVDFKR